LAGFSNIGLPGPCEPDLPAPDANPAMAPCTDSVDVAVGWLKGRGILRGGFTVQ